MANDDDIFSHLGADERTILKPTPSSSGGDKTILKPTPGGKRENRPPQPTGAGMPHYSGGVPQSPPVAAPIAASSLHNVFDATDTNPIITVAKPLLSLLTRLSQTHQHNDVNGLHARTVQEIRNFETNAQQKGIENEPILIARYILCAAIDETVLNTPWGSNSLWPNQSLLSTFHRENTGGQKFFTIMERMQHNPGVNINLLELISLCLSLGFVGKYRVVSGGLSHIETIRSQLHQQIVSIRREYEHDLSPQSEGVHIKRAADRNIPIWVIAAVAMAIITATYITFSVLLNEQAQPLLQNIQAINPIEVEQTTKQ